MAVTITLYNHTAQKIQSGAFDAGDTFKVALYSAMTFDASHTTKAAVDAAATELSTANGYTAGGATLANVAVTTVTTNDSKFDADDVTWTASGGSIAAAYALIYDDTETDDPPMASIDFGETLTAADGLPFKITWNASGIFTVTVA